MEALKGSAPICFLPPCRAQSFCLETIVRHFGTNRFDSEIQGMFRVRPDGNSLDDVLNIGFVVKRLIQDNRRSDDNYYEDISTLH